MRILGFFADSIQRPGARIARVPLTQGAATCETGALHGADAAWLARSPGTSLAHGTKGLFAVISEVLTARTGRRGRRRVLVLGGPPGRDLSMLKCWALGHRRAPGAAEGIGLCRVSGVLRTEERVGLDTAPGVVVADGGGWEFLGAGRVGRGGEVLARSKSRGKVAVQAGIVTGIGLNQGR
jgi:hypothetical protein